MTYQLERTYIGADTSRNGPKTVMDALKYDDLLKAQGEADRLNSKPFNPFFWRTVDAKQEVTK